MNFNFQPPFMFLFFIFHIKCITKCCSSFERCASLHFMVQRLLVQLSHPPQKFEHPPFWYGWSYGIRHSPSVAWPPNWSSSKFYQGQMDRQIDIRNLTFLFKKNRLKIYGNFTRWSSPWGLLSRSSGKKWNAYCQASAGVSMLPRVKYRCAAALWRLRWR